MVWAIIVLLVLLLPIFPLWLTGIYTQLANTRHQLKETQDDCNHCFESRSRCYDQLNEAANEVRALEDKLSTLQFDHERLEREFAEQRGQLIHAGEFRAIAESKLHSLQARAKELFKCERS